MATSRNDDFAGVYFEQGSCKIILKQGDLFSERDVDVIVIPTPESGVTDSHTYPLFEALRSKANPSLKQQIKKLSEKIQQRDPPQIISDAKPSIILTPIPYFGNENKAPKMLQDTYTACLKLAVKEKYQTIAFPTIGCGKSGFNSTDAAKVLHKAMTGFEQSNKGKLNEIRIVIYDNDIYNQFTNVFMDLGQEKNAKIKLIEILSRDSNRSEMPSRKENNQTSRDHSQRTETNKHTDDSDEDKDKNRRGDVKRQTSGLNPETQEFQPRNKNKNRVPRHYRLSNSLTELVILQGDILKTKVDAIVNAANEQMLGGGGVDGIIHKAAGNELYNACKAHKKIYPDVRLPIGRSRILLSYNMSPTTYYIINTSGPRYDDAPPDKCKTDLISCYKTSLNLANLYDLETIGFTAISCGIFGYPIDEGAEVALTTVDKEADSMRQVFFVLKDDEIYDAWIKKAEELQFISLDDSSAVAASTATRSNDNKKNSKQEPSSNNKSKVRKQPSEMKVIDQSTSDNTQKARESNDEEPPEDSSTNPHDSSHNQGTGEHEEDKNASDKDEKKKSDEQESNSQQVKETSDNPDKQEQNQIQDSKPPPSVPHKDTNKSVISGGAGRGRIKNK